MAGNYVQAVGAYHKIMQASKGIKPSQAMKAAEQSMNILRQGDNLEVVKVGKKDSFPAIVNDIVKTQTNKIKSVDRKFAKAVGKEDSGDLLEVISAVNESEVALQAVIAVRDRFISAYQDIIKMPI